MNDQPEIHGSHDLSQDSHWRPRVTLAIFAFNQQSFARAAAEGALAQDYDGPLEIILSDDGSQDATYSVMQEAARAYSGPHHVRLNRNQLNLGLSAHVNRVLAMAQGELLVMADGDDISLPSRVRDTVEVFSRHPEAMAVSFEDVRIDVNDLRCDNNLPSGVERIISLEEFLAAGPRAQSRLGLNAASRALRREVYTTFGFLRPDCPAEDSPYVLRTLYLGPLVVCGKPGIRYRVHAEQMSSAGSIAQMDPALFMAQYQQDLDLALATKLVIPATAATVRAHFAEREIDFLMRKLAYTNQTPTSYMLKRVLASPYYNLREKLGLLKRFLLRRLLS
jgi:glycosyltransferase involved in cell wall biosynthesis